MNEKGSTRQVIPFSREREPDPPADPERLLTCEEVCMRLRVNRSWAYNDKTLPWIKVGKYKRLKASDLEEFIANRTRRNVMRHQPATKNQRLNEPMD